MDQISEYCQAFLEKLRAVRGGSCVYAIRIEKA
jgi:hypothetical protein